MAIASCLFFFLAAFWLIELAIGPTLPHHLLLLLLLPDCLQLLSLCQGLSSSNVKHVELSARLAVHTINYVIHVGDWPQQQQ